MPTAINYIGFDQSVFIHMGAAQANRLYARFVYLSQSAFYKGKRLLAQCQPYNCIHSPLKRKYFEMAIFFLNMENRYSVLISNVNANPFTFDNMTVIL